MNYRIAAILPFIGAQLALSQDFVQNPDSLIAKNQVQCEYILYSNPVFGIQYEDHMENGSRKDMIYSISCYDTAGNLICKKKGDGNELKSHTLYQYNEFSKVIKIESVNHSKIDPGNYEIQITYDSNRIRSKTRLETENQEGKKTISKYSYNDFGKIETVNHYEMTGNKATLLLTQQYQYTYDSLHRKTSFKWHVVYHDDTTLAFREKYLYDAKGNILIIKSHNPLSKNHSRHIWLHNQYNRRGKRTGQILKCGMDTNKMYVMKRIQYDENSGHIVQETDGSVTISYSHRKNQLKKVTTCQFDNCHSTYFKYFNNGLLKEIHCPERQLKYDFSYDYYDGFLKTLGLKSNEMLNTCHQ